jgi:hypothetical protein
VDSFDSSLIGRLLLVLGLAVAVFGALLVFGWRPPLGRLPGDLSGSHGNFSWAIPLGTSLLISVVLTVIVNLVLRR